MKNLCTMLIKSYRKYISPLKPPCCRFYPTCSEYAVQAFSKHGFFWGLILSFYRILRCNPLCKPGYDPVPDKIAASAILTKLIIPIKKLNIIFSFFSFKFLNRRRQIPDDIK